MTDISLHDAIQINKALEVLHLLTNNPRMSQEKACENVGISRNTFRKWISTQNDALISFEEARTEIERNELAAYLISKNAVTNAFIQDSMKPGVSITERIKALEHIEKRVEDLSNRYHTVDIEAEQDLLSGPKLLPGTSKLSNRISVEEKSNETVIKIKDKPDVIVIQGDSDVRE